MRSEIIWEQSPFTSWPVWKAYPAMAVSLPLPWRLRTARLRTLGSWLTFLLGSRCLTSALGYEMEEEGICLPA